MVKLFVCLECRKVFEEPIYWEEDRGECFGFPSYERFSGCPMCHGAYTEAYECDCCGEVITDDYIKIEDKRYCQECCQTVELGEGD